VIVVAGLFHKHQLLQASFARSVMDSSAATETEAEFVRRATEAMSSAKASVQTSNPIAVVTPLEPFESLCDLAAPVYASLKDSDAQTIITVSPALTGTFRRMTIPTGDVYRGSTCEMSLDDVIRNELCDEDDDIFADDRGHQPAPVGDHLPFLKALYPEGTLVPIVMGEETLDFCRELSTALAEVMFNKRVMLVATIGAPEGDSDALNVFRDALSRGDIESLQRLHVNKGIQLNGFGALIVVLQAAAERRARDVEILSSSDSAICAIVSRGS
jgi:MEMO1 family protein